MTEKRKTGFAAMTKEKRLEASAKGGRNVAPGKRAYALDPALAREAAVKSLEVRRAKGFARGSAKD